MLADEWLTIMFAEDRLTIDVCRRQNDIWILLVCFHKAHLPMDICVSWNCIYNCMGYTYRDLLTEILLLTQKWFMLEYCIGIAIKHINLQMDIAFVLPEILFIIVYSIMYLHEKYWLIRYFCSQNTDWDITFDCFPT